MLTVPPTIVFQQGKPFYTMVMTFLTSAVGLGPVFDPANPLNLNPSQGAFFTGRIQPMFVIDMGQIVQQITVGNINANQALTNLCCMLVNTAYEAVKTHNDHSPEFEIFRHVRNAPSHQNVFNFLRHEPSRPAAWRSFTIDHNNKGASNGLYGQLCFGNVFAPADAILLLWDIEQRIP